jgi:hypothetical protein
VTSVTVVGASATDGGADTGVVDIGWAGDTTLGSKYGNPPRQGKALFAQVRSQLRAPDLMILNLEGSLSTATTSKCDVGTSKGSKSCFAFQAPPKNAEALAWAGVDLVSLANNHSYDYLEAGFGQTQKALTGANVAYTGLRNQIAIKNVNGVRVAVDGFSPYSWSAPLNDLSRARALVRKAAARTDVVVVLMHAGAEGVDKIHTPTGTEYAYGEPRGDSRRFARAVIDSGADVVLGSGPHVVRGIERYRGKPIAYSLGDFAGWANFGLGGNLSLSGILTVKLDGKGRFLGGKWDSVRLASPGVPEPDPTNASAKLVRKLSSEDFSDTFAMSASGELEVP